VAEKRCIIGQPNSLHDFKEYRDKIDDSMKKAMKYRVTMQLEKDRKEKLSKLHEAQIIALRRS
jgi:hypothetical protein